MPNVESKVISSCGAAAQKQRERERERERERKSKERVADLQRKVFLIIHSR